MPRQLTGRDALVVLLLLALPLLLLWQVTVGGRTLLPVDNLYSSEPWASHAAEMGVGVPQNGLLSDLILENYAWKSFIRECIRERVLPLWNPRIFAGQPFLANGQHSALYPFSVIFYVVPLPYAYGWFTVLQLWLAGVFTYVFLRVLGVRRFGGLLGGVVYQLGGFMVASVVFTMMIAAAAWLPLVLAWIEVIVRKQEQKEGASYSPIPYVVAGSFTLGVQMLAGHVEITYYVLLVSGLYALYRLVAMWWRLGRAWRAAARIAAWLAVMVALGLGLGTVQFLPLYEVVRLNFRVGSVPYEQIIAWAYPTRQVATFLVPDFFGSPAHHGYFDLASRAWVSDMTNAHGGRVDTIFWGIKNYVEGASYTGILPPVLAAVAVLAALFKRESDKRGTLSGVTWFFAVLAVVSLLFAFGTPLYAIPYHLLPGWDQLHSPFRWVFPYTLCVAVLAGIGAHALAERVSPRDGDDAIHKKQESRLFSFYGLTLAAGWASFWGGAAGAAVLVVAFFYPAPFFEAAGRVVASSDLAANVFADGRAFFSYLWPNLLALALFAAASGAILRISRCPIYLPARLGSICALHAWKPLAVAVVAADLLIAGYGFNPAVDVRLLDYTPPPVEWLRARYAESPHFRLTSFNEPGQPRPLVANAPMFYGLEDVRGYDSIIPKQYADYMALIQPQGDLLYNRIAPLYAPGYEALDSALVDLLGVRYVVTSLEIPNDGYRLVYDGELKVYENLDALPRVFAVNCAEIVPGEEERGIALRSLNPRERVILEEMPTEPTYSPGEEFCDTFVTGRISRYRFDEVFVDVTLPKAGFLVLADSYFPGWKAYYRPFGGTEEDEQLLHVYRADGNFRAVALPAGNWTVRFKYAPMSFKLGLYTSFLAGIILVMLGGYWSWGKIYRERETDSSLKRIAKNSIAPMALALMNRLVDFAFALLMLRILAPEGAGRYGFAVAFISFFEIVTRFGLGTLLTREVARDHAQGNRYFSNLLILRGLIWLVALPVMGALLGMYLLFGGLTWDVVITVALFSVGMLLSNVADGITAIFYAYEKMEYPAAISSVTTVTRVSLGALVLLLGGGIIGLAGVSVVANLVSVVVLGRIMLGKVFRPHPEKDASLQRHMLSESFPLMINHLLATIFFRIDVFILKPTWGDAAVGYYSAAYKYIDGINIIPSYFTLALFPLMSRYAKDARESLERAYVLSLRLLLALALPISVGTPFIAHELILLLGGGKYLPDSMIALQLLIWFLPFSFINQVTQYVLIAVDQQRFLTKAFVIGVTFNFLVNIVLIPLYGYRAAAITTILSEWALLIPFYYCVRKNLCRVPWVSVSWRPVVSSAVMGLALWFARDAGPFVIVPLGGAVYFAAMFAVGGFRQADMGILWSRLRRARG